VASGATYYRRASREYREFRESATRARGLLGWGVYRQNFHQRRPEDVCGPLVPDRGYAESPHTTFGEDLFHTLLG
jgi:hypothetical protein